MNDFYDEDSDDDLNQPRVQQIFVPRNNYWVILNDEQFRQRFCLRKEPARFLLNRIRPDIENITDRHWAITPSTQILIVLRMYATGSFMQVIGDFLGISKTSVWKITHRVSAVIASLRAEFIRFPSTPEEIKRSQTKFFTKAGLPGVIGCVDCKHVKVQSFGGLDAELYRNRKGYFSINVQAICNTNLEIIDIVAWWPGSTHDSTIFNNSRINAQFEAGLYGDALLVGDSGYANRSYLLTPLRNPQTPAEILYQKSQIRTRNSIERCFGVWSRVFYVLSGSRFRRVERILAIIVATAVLHNICRRMNSEDENIDVGAYTEIHNNLNLNMDGDVRQQLIANHFAAML